MLNQKLIKVDHIHIKVDIADAGKNNFTRSNSINVVAERIINIVCSKLLH